MTEDMIFPILSTESKLPLYLVGAGWHENQNPINRVSGFPTFQVIYCTSGTGLLKIESTEYEIAERQGFFLYPDEAHEYHAIREPWETHWVTFGGDDIRRLMQTLGFTKSSMFYIRDPIALNDLWRCILLEGKSNNYEKGYQCSALTYSFLILLRSIATEQPSIKDDKWHVQLNTVLSFIDDHLACTLSLNDISDSAGISTQYLCRLFKMHLNMRPIEYVTKRRIQEAKKMLAESQLPELDIAARCGFNSFSYFCTCFKRQEQITPSDFRRLHCVSKF